MSITKNLSVKVGPQQGVTYELDRLQQIGATLASQTAASNSVWVTDNTVTLNDIGAARPLLHPNTYVTEDDLQKDVFSIPVDRLIDLWCVRFGNSWVNLEDIETDDFFITAYKRLKSLGELEVHYLTDRARYVCRVPE